MSKKKTEAEMRAIAEMIKNMVKDWNEDDFDDEAETEDLDSEGEEEDEEEQYYRYPECECVDGECDQCEHWVYNDCCELDDEGEDCEEDENEYYRHNECEDHDGDCEDCSYYNEDDCCCELDNEDEEDGDAFDDCNDRDYDCNQWSSKEHTQTEELSKFIMSVNTVLGSDMGLLIFDKSNKKDMEKIAAIFGEYAKRLS